MISKLEPYTEKSHPELFKRLGAKFVHEEVNPAREWAFSDAKRSDSPVMWVDLHSKSNETPLIFVDLENGTRIFYANGDPSRTVKYNWKLPGEMKRLRSALNAFMVNNGYKPFQFSGKAV